MLGIAIDIGGRHATCALVDGHGVRRKATEVVREVQLTPTFGRP